MLSLLLTTLCLFTPNMVEIETKGLLALLAAPESLMGVLLLAGALVLFRFTLSEPNLSHIPLSDADLSRAERWNGFVNDPEGVLARGYKKVFTSSPSWS